MMKLSVAIATFNEEKNIERCLKSVKSWVDEIVMVDGSSTDSTVEIARKYNVKIIKSDNPAIFHINKQKAVDNCKGEWILQLDADEIIEEGLKKEIETTVNKPSSKDGYYIPRKNFLLGRFIKKGGLYPDYVIRFFKRGKGRFPCKSVHEQIEIDGSPGYLKNELIHNAYPDFSDYLKKANTYTTLRAQGFRQSNLGVNFYTTMIYIIVVPAGVFINIYFRHLGLLDGFPGFVWALFSALDYPISYIKYWEMERNRYV